MIGLARALLRGFLGVHLILRLLVLVTLAASVYLAVTFVQVWQASRRDGARPSEAIVVLGAAQYDGRPSPVYRARLDHAADLYDAGLAPVMVVTGGRAEGDRFTEATAGANYLLGEHAIPDSAILRETGGHSSWESLAASARFLRERGIDEVILVSDPFHAERIEATAAEVGLRGSASPTRTSPVGGATEVRLMLRETVKVAAGRLFGFRRMMRLRGIPGLGVAAATAPAVA